MMDKCYLCKREKETNECSKCGQQICERCVDDVDFLASIYECAKCFQGDSNG